MPRSLVCSGPRVLLDRATQMTTMPTMMTTMVAPTGTMTLMSNQTGSHGKNRRTSPSSPPFFSESPEPPLRIGGAIVPVSRDERNKKEVYSLRTFLVVVTFAFEDADHDDGHDNDEHRRNNRHHQI